MKKKMLGALALSAALAIGTAVPAFAVEQDDVDGKVEQASGNISAGQTAGTGEGATEVFVEANIGQLNVTVPVKMVVAAEVAGGTAMTPSPSAYKIINKGTIPVYLKSTEAQQDSTTGRQWALAQTALTPTSLVNGTIGDIYMTILPGTCSAAGAFTPSTTVTTPKCITETTAVTDYTADWEVPAAGRTDGEMALKTEASTSQLNVGTLTANSDGMSYQAVQAFKIVYTISSVANV